MNADTYFVRAILALSNTLRARLVCAGYETVAALKAAEDGDLLQIEGLRRRDLIAIRTALGQPTDHLIPRKGDALPVPAEDALELLAAYQACRNPKHRELLVKLAKVLATKDDAHLPA